MIHNKQKQGRSCAILIFLSLFFVGSVFAQTAQVKGRVTQQSDGTTIPGVTIRVSGEDGGTITDLDGNYVITAEKNATLIFSYVGYLPQEVAINGQSTINVALVQDMVNLNEVVAIGYGSVRKKDITGSVSSISAKDLTVAPIASIDQGMQGKLAGVSIQNTSGAPGQKMKIRIRGGNSINYSNEPLYVIDGFIGADITTINPNDIASIDILKDASATAIYGSRGANGVVLITTNAPESGELKVSFEANYGISTMANQYDILPAGEMAELINLKGAGQQTPTTYFSQTDIDGFKERGGTDWVDLVTRTGQRENYTLNLTGGNEKLKYYFSANHLDEQGIIEDSYYKRTSVRSNISGKISSWIDFKFNTFGTHTDAQNNSIQSNGTANTIGRAVVFPQIYPNKDENGEYSNPTTLNSYGFYNTGLYPHPVVANQVNGETFNEKIISNLDLTFDLGYNFSLFVSNAGSFAYGYNGAMDIVDYITVADRNSMTAEQKYNRTSSYINTDILTYQNDFGKHSLKVDAVYEFSKTEARNNQAKVNELSTLGNDWHLLQNGAPSLTSSAYSIVKIRSYMGRFNYNYADKYLVTASIRADGISKFHEDKRWGYFPSAAIGWRISEEPFLKDLEWIHNTKVRAGYGSVGNAGIPAYGTLSSLNKTDNTRIWTTFDNNTPIAGVIPGNYTDPFITWETTTQLNAGLDLSLFGGRLSAVIDYYNKQSTDVIIKKTLPSFTGRPSFTSNFADIDNKGIEVSLNGYIYDTKDFSWSAGLNFSKNENNVANLDNNESFIFLDDEEPLGIWLGGDNHKFIVQEGEAMGSFYGLKSLGLWQADEAAEAALYESYPGEVKYEDVNGDGAINDGDRQIIGNAAPDFTYGISTNLRYKAFDLAIQCIGSYGNDIFNYSRHLLDREVLNTDYRNRWSVTNTGSSQRIMPIGAEYDRKYVSSYYLEDGSFFKISNVTLGYTLPKRYVEELKISSLRVFVSGNNLLTITNYSGLDPEGSSTSLTSDAQSGVDAFSYPIVRTFTGGVKIGF